MASPARFLSHRRSEFVEAKTVAEMRRAGTKTRSKQGAENSFALMICIGLMAGLVVCALVLSNVLAVNGQATFSREGRILHSMAGDNQCRAVLFDNRSGEPRGEEIVPCGKIAQKFDKRVGDRFDAVRDGFKNR